MELETINKLYLELSQVTTATSGKELRLEAKIEKARSLANELFDKMHVAYTSKDWQECTALASNLVVELK